MEGGSRQCTWPYRDPPQQGQGPSLPTETWDGAQWPCSLGYSVGTGQYSCTILGQLLHLAMEGSWIPDSRVDR